MEYAFFLSTSIYEKNKWMKQNARVSVHGEDERVFQRVKVKKNTPIY